MTRRNFEERSHQQNERRITRVQGDLPGAPNFAAGLYEDRSDTAIPNSGIAKLENWVNYGTYLLGRGGSKKWSAVALPTENVPYGNDYHKQQRKVVLHIGRDLYVTDPFQVSWKKVYPIGEGRIDSVRSFYDGYLQYMFVFCNSKIYRIDLGVDEEVQSYTYYQINTPVPTVLITDSLDEDFEYNYIYAGCRLTGTGIRNRLSSETIIDQETGPTLFNGKTDHGVVTSSTAIDVGSELTIGELTVPDNGEHLTHFPVYRTLDIGESGIDPVSKERHKDYQYVWVEDVPFGKAVTASIDSSGNITVTQGTLENMDIGSSLTALDGTDFVIATVASSTAGTVTPTTAKLSQPFAIGGGTVGRARQTGTTIVFTANIFVTDANIGQQIYFADGSSTTLISISTAQQGQVSDNISRDNQAVTMNPVSRKFADTVTDATLKNRIGAWPLRSRFWKPLEVGDMGVIAFGILWACNRGEETVQYSALPKYYEELAGYFKETDQFVRFQDGIFAMAKQANQVVVFGANSTHVILANTLNENIIEDTGEVVTVAGGFNTVDEYIGTKAPHSIVDIGENRLCLFTSEPGIRVFSGNSYSENLAQDRIITTIRKLEPARVIASYDPYNGYMFWSVQALKVQQTGSAATVKDQSGSRDTIVVQLGIDI